MYCFSSLFTKAMSFLSSFFNTIGGTVFEKFFSKNTRALKQKLINLLKKMVASVENRTHEYLYSTREYLKYFKLFYLFTKFPKLFSNSVLFLVPNSAHVKTLS